MKKIVYGLLFLFPFCSFAQTLSIEQLWESVDNSLGQQRDGLQIQIGQAELDELRQYRIPVFYADANMQRNLIIPTTPVPAIAFDPTAKEGAVIPLKFSTRWSSKVGLQAEWNIFDPKRRLDEKEKTLRIRRAELQKESNAQDWKRNATLAYASVVLATKQYVQAQQDSANYSEIVALSKRRYEAGRENSSVYLETQQEFERKRIQLHEAWSVLWEADLELRKYIDLSETTSLTTDIVEIQEFVQDKSDKNYAVQLLEIDREVADLETGRIKRQLLPTLTMNAYLGEQYFSNELQLTKRDDWFGNSYVNLALRIPLSAYFTSRPVLRQTQLQSTLYSKQIEEEIRNDDIDNQQNAVNLKAAQQKIQSLKHIEQLAKQNMEEQKAAYLGGRLLLDAYNRSIITHHRAVLDIWQAEYDFIALLLD
jgi:outer membrane protein TolC